MEHRSVVNLTRRHRPVVVYVAPTRSFNTMRSLDHLTARLEAARAGRLLPARRQGRRRASYAPAGQGALSQAVVAGGPGPQASPADPDCARTARPVSG